MHCVHLGLDLWIAGNTFQYLLDNTSVWGSGDPEERLLASFREYKLWVKENKIS